MDVKHNERRLFNRWYNGSGNLRPSSHTLYSRLAHRMMDEATQCSPFAWRSTDRVFTRGYSKGRRFDLTSIQSNSALYVDGFTLRELGHMLLSQRVWNLCNTENERKEDWFESKSPPFCLTFLQSTYSPLFANFHSRFPHRNRTCCTILRRAFGVLSPRWRKSENIIYATLCDLNRTIKSVIKSFVWLRLKLLGLQAEQCLSFQQYFVTPRYLFWETRQDNSLFP